MILRDLTDTELEALQSVVSNKPFKKLIQSRTDEMKDIEWSLPVITEYDIARLAEAKGMIKAWSSILKLEEGILEEKEIRKEELEKERAIAARLKR
jgi:uncharacterized 2Fe-2S/4Fe-4S cluster protein (DUF4445 family)